jgi:hypothetical protein
MYSIDEMDRYNTEYHRQLHFNFSETKNTQKQRQSTEATCASWLRDIDLDAQPEQLALVLPSKQHELLLYVLEDILDCPVDSRFIVCIAVDRGDLEQGTYYAEKAKNVASDLKQAGLDAKWWRMSGKKYMVIQGKVDQSSHYSDIKLKSFSKHQFFDAFFNESGDIAIQFEGISTWLTIPLHDIIHGSKSIMLFGDPFTQGRSFTSLF